MCSILEVYIKLITVVSHLELISCFNLFNEADLNVSLMDNFKGKSMPQAAVLSTNPSSQKASVLMKLGPFLLVI